MEEQENTLRASYIINFPAVIPAEQRSSFFRCDLLARNRTAKVNKGNKNFSISSRLIFPREFGQFQSRNGNPGTIGRETKRSEEEAEFPGNVIYDFNLFNR